MTTKNINPITPTIEKRIFTIRGKQVMIDRDLAELFTVSTKVLNQAVKRNSNRFPEMFKFQLTLHEFSELVTNCDRFEKLKHSSHLPFAFTEYGVAMLPSVLRSETAISISLEIIKTFVEMRKLVMNYDFLVNRLDKIEYKQFKAEEKFNKIFTTLENKNQQPDKGIFYNGEVFDAYTFISGLVRKAEKSIRLIDNYVDDTVLTLFSKRKKDVQLIIYTKVISKQLQLDLSKFNEQYPPAEIKPFGDSHDRFLLIDDIELYHIGASLKDLGKKWFAFSKMDRESISILQKLN